eukprot:740546_1
MHERNQISTEDALREQIYESKMVNLELANILGSYTAVDDIDTDQSDALTSLNLSNCAQIKHIQYRLLLHYKYKSKVPIKNLSSTIMSSFREITPFSHDQLKAALF